MKKILMIPEGNWLAHVSRPLVFANVLRNKGYEVLFACSGKHSDLPRQAGFPTHPLFTKDPEHGLTKARRLGSSYDDFLVKNYVESEIECLSKLKPALVVGDFRITLSISTELLDIPYISILNAYWTNFYSARSAAPESMRITQLLGQRLSNLLLPLIKPLVLKWAAIPFNRERRRRKLKPCGNIFDIMASKILNLLVDAPEYAPTQNLPSNFRYVGPIIWEPPVETPPWLSGLDPKKPIIYYTLGSTGSRESAVNLIDAFANTDYQIIVSTGEIARLSKTPPNFHVAEYLPGIKIMGVCHLVICHGGNGTIYQALTRGVPIIGIPTMHDQEINMDRIVDLGVGIKLSERKLETQGLIEAIEKILSDPHYLQNARRLQEIISKYNAPHTGARLIEDLLYEKGPEKQ